MDKPAWPAFDVANFRAVEYGKVRLLFDLRVGPIVLRDCNLIVDDDGHPKFAAPARIREKFSDAFVSTVDADRNFMRVVLDAVVKRVREVRKSKGTEPSGAARDDWATVQEARFDQAFAELEAGAQ